MDEVLPLATYERCRHLSLCTSPLENSFQTFSTTYIRVGVLRAPSRGYLDPCVRGIAYRDVGT